MLTTIDNETTIAADNIFAFQKTISGNQGASGVFYCLVFHSQGDLSSINEKERRKLYYFISSCVKMLQGTVEFIAEKPDSIEMLVKLNEGQNPADFIQRAKLITSTWIRRKLNMPEFAWCDVEISTFSELLCEPESGIPKPKYSF